MQFVLKDAEANVLCPATKLWNTGHGANMMREAVSLMGGYGITEDCPGFLANKWMDAQLEATYEGPEAVQRRQLTVTMTNEVFLAQFRAWTARCGSIASDASRHRRLHAGLGHEAVAVDAESSAESHRPDGAKLYHGQRQGVTFALADALCWLLASRCQILDVLELEARGAGRCRRCRRSGRHRAVPQRPCHTQAAQAAGEVSRICAELVFGYNRHPAWDEEEHQQLLLWPASWKSSKRPCPASRPWPSMCWRPTAVIRRKPARARVAQAASEFLRLQNQLDSCLTGSRLAKDRAAETVSKVMIPEALDYPA